MDRELLLLKIRSAIADKEFAIASANRETQYYGNWQCNWSEFKRDADIEIQKYLDALNVNEV